MSKSFEKQIGDQLFTIETGKLAQQANGAVVVRQGDSMVLVTATMAKPREGIDFFPLTIDFEERLYARGRIPGGFPRREGRPTTDTVLTMRLTDRPLRPLFPKDFRNEVQIITTPLSADLETPLDIMSIVGASTALSISDIPFNGPIGVTRIGCVDGEFVINPTYQQSDESTLDLVVAGSRDGVLMMEAGASEVSDEMVLDAIKLAQDTNLQLIELQDEIVEAVAKPKSEYNSFGYAKELDSLVNGAVEGKLADAMSPEGGKADMAARLGALKDSVVAEIGEEYEGKDVSEAFETFVEKEFRRRIIEFGERPDGRGVKEIRPLLSETSISPRAHGTGLFQRGETQVLAFTTLGPVGDKQKIDNLTPVDLKRFMLHYNFPPFSTGETGRMFTGRREIGHGALAERAIASVLPSEEDFPYAIRVVAECLSSNGSTSMASTCAGILALMDAGVPISKPVAGISIGLVTDDEGRFVTLTDIQGMEDHFGDMDFKVAGTADGITAIQLDIKVQNIGFEVIEQTLAQAKEARIEVLAKMAEAIDAPRAEVSQYAPRMTSVSIPVSKIGAVIGPGGKTIRGIIEETGAQVDVQDDGTVFVSSVDGDASKRAVEMIENLTKEAKIGDIYTGKVVRILGFGAFVEILPGQDGMVHISELSDHRVESVEDEIEMGQELTVQVIDVDPQGKISLSRRSLLLDEDMETVAARRQGSGGNGRSGGGGRGGPRRDGGRPPRREGPRRDYGGGRPPRRDDSRRGGGRDRR
ncbi:MAG: polyribonucleotide nucleotidyltransferase [Dehalococcoidia bacterium]|nr:polyribonucleotide nucleotidyltransferase [Dehalococcoidia bacterium]